MISKILMHPGRAVIIKMPLLRRVMPKRELHGYLRRRRSGERSLLAASARLATAADGEVAPSKRLAWSPLVAADGRVIQPPV